MSIDVSKIIQTYQSCLTLLKAKKYLYVDSSQLNALLSRPELKSKERTNLYAEYIEDGILKIIRTWSKKFSAYQSLQDSHKYSLTQLQFKIETLKNNTEVVSREDQLFAEIQAIMAEWRQNMNPVQYYSNKFKKELKAHIQQKLQNLKMCATNSHHSSAPLYPRKIENEYKDNIIATYNEELKIDEKLIETTISIQNQLAQVIGELDNNLNRIQVRREISLENNHSFRQAYQIMNKTTRPNEKKIAQYNQFLNEAIRKNYQYWVTLKRSLDFLLFFISQTYQAIVAVKSNFEEKQDKICKLLSDVPNPIAHIFRADLVYSLIQSFNCLHGAASILMSFKSKIEKRREFAIKNQIQCRNYSSKLSSQALHRNQNFIHFALTDKKFFEDQAKSEKIAIKLLMQSFREFLEDCLNLTRETNQIFVNHSRINPFQEHDLVPILSKIVSSDVSSSNIRQSSSTNDQNSSSRTSYLQTKRVLTKQKVAKIEQFLDSLSVFKSDSVTDDDKSFSCALGPKLLLHGKLYVLPDGLFFESHFNKKNLLFGKTKLFIPKSQIVQIDTKKTLKVFPDAVLIKTEHGLVSFHALGHRKIISDAIKQAYLGQCSQETGDVKNEKPNFKPMNQSKKPSDGKIQQSTKQLQVMITETTLKGSNLGNVFRRYFSDDKFQLKGKQYQNYKSYSLTLIQAKNPKSTPLTPSPPSYFLYKTENGPEDHYPESSTRTHNYNKDLPKIPFLSKGGQGKCEEKETYVWLGPETLVIDVLSTVSGFSLTEGMQIFIKYVLKQVDKDVKITVSAEVKFQKQSSSNGLVKNPTISNIKDTVSKVLGTIQKCEKSQQQGASKTETSTSQEKVQQKKPESQDNHIQISRQQVIYIGIGFIIFYLLTILAVRLF